MATSGLNEMLLKNLNLRLLPETNTQKLHTVFRKIDQILSSWYSFLLWKQKFKWVMEECYL